MPATTLADRAIIRVSGEGARDFLQGLVTSDVTGTLPVWAGLLTPQGKALFDFLLWPDGDDVLVDCEADQSEALARRLNLYRLRRPIAIGREESLSVHWSPPPLGLSSSKPLPSSGGTEESEALGEARAERDMDPRLPELGKRWLAPASGGDASAEYRAHRLALGVTEGVAELGSDRTLWLECNARELGGVSFTKGCYVGQENTARMHHRAKVNRRLVVRRVAADPGDAARAYYPALGVGVALARVEAIAGDAAVVVPDWLAAALTA